MEAAAAAVELKAGASWADDEVDEGASSTSFLRDRSCLAAPIEQKKKTRSLSFFFQSSHRSEGLSLSSSFAQERSMRAFRAQCRARVHFVMIRARFFLFFFVRLLSLFLLSPPIGVVPMLVSGFSLFSLSFSFAGLSSASSSSSSPSGSRDKIAQSLHDRNAHEDLKTKKNEKNKKQLMCPSFRRHRSLRRRRRPSPSQRRPTPPLPGRPRPRSRPPAPPPPPTPTPASPCPTVPPSRPSSPTSPTTPSPQTSGPTFRRPSRGSPTCSCSRTRTRAARAARSSSSRRASAWSGRCGGTERRCAGGS